MLKLCKKQEGKWSTLKFFFLVKFFFKKKKIVSGFLLFKYYFQEISPMKTLCCFTTRHCWNLIYKCQRQGKDNMLCEYYITDMVGFIICLFVKYEHNWNNTIEVSVFANDWQQLSFFFCKNKRYMECNILCKKSKIFPRILFQI